MEVDKFELLKQHKEEIINSGNYAMVTCIVPGIDDPDGLKEVIPIVDVKQNHCSVASMALMAISLDDAKETLLEDADVKKVYELMKMFATKKGKIEIEKGEENE